MYLYQYHTLRIIQARWGGCCPFHFSSQKSFFLNLHMKKWMNMDRVSYPPPFWACKNLRRRTTSSRFVSSPVTTASFSLAWSITSDHCFFFFSMIDSSFYNEKFCNSCFHLSSVLWKLLSQSFSKFHSEQWTFVCCFRLQKMSFFFTWKACLPQSL